MLIFQFYHNHIWIKKLICLTLKQNFLLPTVRQLERLGVKQLNSTLDSVEISHGHSSSQMFGHISLEPISSRIINYWLIIALLDSTTGLRVNGFLKRTTEHSIKVVNSGNQFAQILDGFKDILVLPENKPIPQTATFHRIISYY